VVRGMTGVVVGNGISKKYDSLENKKTSLLGFGEPNVEFFEPNAKRKKTS
jgi:hypothetical protein